MNHASDFGFSIDGQLPSTETTMNTATCKHNHDEYSTGTVCKQCEQEQEDAAYELRQAEWRKADDARRLKQREKNDAVLQNLANAVKKVPGHTAELIDHNMFVDGVAMNWLVEIKDELGSSSWRKKPTGRIRVTIGDWGDRKSFTQLKDCSFSPACVNELIDRAARKLLAAKQEAKKKENSEIVSEFLKSRPLNGYGVMRVKASVNEAAPIHVDLGMGRAMTAEEAAKLHDALKAIGLI